MGSTAIFVVFVVSILVSPTISARSSTCAELKEDFYDRGCAGRVEDPSMLYMSHDILQWINSVKKDSCDRHALQRVELRRNDLRDTLGEDIFPRWVLNSHRIGHCPQKIEPVVDIHRHPSSIAEVKCDCQNSPCGRKPNYMCTPVKKSVTVQRHGFIDTDEVTVACVCARRNSIMG